jgi:hypothetical protein
MKKSIEQSITKIALLMSRYRSVHWGIENICLYTGEGIDEAEGAIEAMRKKKYVGGNTSFFLTDTGLEFVDGLKRNVSITHSAATERKFKDEALTGVVEVKHRRYGWLISERSEIDSAAVTGASPPHTTETPESMFIRAHREFELKKKTAERLGVDINTLTDLASIGRIQLCNSCNSIELFDRKGPDRWQPICRKCRKRQGR